MSENILSVRDLSVHYVKEKNVVKAVNHLTFEPCSESARPDCRR